MNKPTLLPEGVVIPKELLREARDNCEASIAEAGISTHRREYRIDLYRRLKEAYDSCSGRGEYKCRRCFDAGCSMCP